MEKRIIKEIILKYEKDNKGIYCKGNEAFKMIWGSATNPGDISSKYEIKKQNGKFFIPKPLLLERKAFIEGKIKKLQAGLKILKEAIE